MVQNGSPIENLYSYPIGVNPVTFLVNYTDPNYETIVSDVSETHIPVVVGASHSEIPFDLSTYYSELKTENFGRNIIVGDNIPSTMDIGHDFGNIQGMVFIANKQTNGRGSNTTKWESPRGDIYMNINLELSNKSQQVLLPIHCDRALISAVKSTPSGDYSSLPIKFLWPIAVTWMPWNRKVGGVLVEPTQTDDTNKFWYTSGCGLRVNSDIANSVSKMIDEYNAKNPNSHIKQLELSSLIARTVNYLEEYYKLLQTDPEGFNKLILEHSADTDQ